MNKPRRDPYFYQYSSENKEQSKWSVEQPTPVRERKSWISLFDAPHKLISFIVVIVFAMGVGLYTWLTPDTPDLSGEIPLIKPLEGPAKIRPENPGGIQVPHQDKMIYDRLNPQAQTQGEPEPQLAASPDLSYPPLHVKEPVQAENEQTMSQEGGALHVNFDAWPKATPPHLAERPQAQAQVSTGVVPSARPPASVSAESIPSAEEVLLPPSSAVTNIPAEAPQNVVEAITPDPSQVSAAPQEKKSPPVVKPNQKAVVSKVTAKTVKPVVSKVKTASKTPVIGSHTYRLQVGSLASQKQAEDEKKRLWAKHGALLSKYQSKIIRVDLGARGVRYRVIVGPLPNEAKAKALCQNLNQQKVGCLMIRPGG